MSLTDMPFVALLSRLTTFCSPDQSHFHFGPCFYDLIWYCSDVFRRLRDVPCVCVLVFGFSL